MMKRLWLLPLMLLLMAQDCETPPPPANEYCSGAVMRPEPGVLDSLMEGVGGVWNTIIGGTPSTDRRATVKVLFGSAYCTGTVIGKRTVLTAGHCGYASATTHTILIEDGQRIASTSHLVHPDYFKWVYKHDLEGRKSDLMLLFTDQDLPGPIVDNLYDSSLAALCTDLLAQGYGQVGEGDTPGLNESHYTVTWEEDKSLITKQATPGGSCFGDSGSALYALLGDNPVNLKIAGVLSTTASSDCLISATYVKAEYFREWIAANTR